MPRKKQKQKNAHVVRKFLTKELKQQIIDSFNSGETIEQIAEKIQHSKRQVKDFINNYQSNKENVFTREEDTKILEMLKQGITSESFIAKSLPGKRSWMVRNRIKYHMRRHGSIKHINIDFTVNCMHANEKLDIPNFEYDNNYNNIDNYFTDFSLDFY